MFTRVGYKATSSHNHLPCKNYNACSAAVELFLHSGAAVAIATPLSSGPWFRRRVKVLGKATLQ